MTLQVFPSTLLSGGAGAVLATFTNTGDSTLNHVVLTVDLGGATFDGAGSSSGCTASGSIVTCGISPVGGILTGAVVKTTIAFTGVPSPVTFSGNATWASPNSGKPNGTPVPRNVANATPVSPNVVTVTNASSSCKPGGDTLSQQNDGGQAIGVTAGNNTLGLACTPMAAGIDDGGILFTKLPPLTAPATVTLTFPDDTLPSTPSFTDPDHPALLAEYPNYPDLGTTVTVPDCDFSGGTPSIPAGADSCIVSVNPSADDDDIGFSDAGTIDLLVQGSATGDPGYH